AGIRALLTDLAIDGVNLHRHRVRQAACVLRSLLERVGFGRCLHDGVSAGFGHPTVGVLHNVDAFHRSSFRLRVWNVSMQSAGLSRPIAWFSASPRSGNRFTRDPDPQTCAPRLEAEETHYFPAIFADRKVLPT